MRLTVDPQRPHGARDFRHLIQRDDGRGGNAAGGWRSARRRSGIRAGGRPDVDAAQRRGVILQRMGCFQNDLIVVRLGEDRRDLLRTIGVVERSADLIGVQAEGAGLGAVHFDPQFRICDAQVAVGVLQLRQRLQSAQHFRAELVEGLKVAGLQRILVGRLGGAAAVQIEVLHRREDRVDARHGRSDAAHAGDDVVNLAALAFRLERDEDVALAGAALSDRRDDVIDGGIGLDVAGDLLLALGHGREGDVGSGFRRSRDVAGVLDGEKALGDGDEHRHAEDEGSHRDEHHDDLMAQHQIERPAITVRHAVDDSVDHVPEPALTRMVVHGLQQAGAEHRGERQRHEARHQNGAGDRHRELAQHAPDDSAHQQHGDEHGDERKRDRQNGVGDFPRTLDRRFEGAHPLLDVPHDVLKHDDGVIDDESHRQRDREQRNIVDGIAKHIHEGAGSDQRHRQGQRGNDRRRRGLQEQENDEDDEGDGQPERELHVLDRRADRDGTIIQHAGFHGGRQLRAVDRQFILDRVHDRDRVGVGLTENREGDATLLVLPRSDLVVVDGVVNLGHFIQVDRRAIAPGDDDVVEVFGLCHLARGFERHVLVDAAQAADGRRGVRRNNGVANVVQRQAACEGCVRISIDAHCVFLLPEHDDLRHAGQLGNLLGENLFRVIVHGCQGKDRRAEHQDQHGRVGRIDLLETRRRRQLRGQAAQGGGDHRLNVERGAVDVAIQIELHRDVRPAIGRTRRHEADARNGGEGALKRRDHRRGHGLGIGAGQTRVDRHRREIDAGQGRDRQFHIAENSEDDERHHQQRRHHGTTDAKFRERHQIPSFLV